MRPKPRQRNGVDEYGRTDLHYAAMDGNLNELEMLVLAELNIDAKDDKGFTPLHFAVQEGHLEAVYFLLTSGADPDLKNHAKRSAYDLALKAGGPMKALFEAEPT